MTCQVCNSSIVMQEYAIKNKKSHVEEILNTRCANCGNLVFGFSRPLR